MVGHGGSCWLIVASGAYAPLSVRGHFCLPCRLSWRPGAARSPLARNWQRGLTGRWCCVLDSLLMILVQIEAGDDKGGHGNEPGDDHGGN